MHRTLHAGFTLIEIIVVIALFGMMAGLGLFMSMETFRGTTFRAEESTLVSIFQRARSRAMANLYQTSWGVCYQAPDYVIFRGSGYSAGAATNEVTAGNAAVTIAGMATCSPGGGTVFDQLTGNTSGVSVITISQPGRPDATITINDAGTIIW